MIIEIRAKNCFAFNEPVAFSMNADMRNKKFAYNVHNENGFNVLKTAGIYGPNNSGKTCLIKCIRAIRQILLNEKPDIMSNLFNESNICTLGLTFLHNGRKFSYDFNMDVESETFIYERFSEILKDKYGNEKEVLMLEKDIENSRFYCLDQDVVPMMHMMSIENLFFYCIDANRFPHLKEMKQVLTDVAGKIDIINMNNIPMTKTIELMKKKDSLQPKVVSFIKNADIYMDDFRYEDLDKIPLEFDFANLKPDETVLNNKDTLTDQIRLVSTYKGVSVPSIIFDSTGTKKLAALASYIIEGLEAGRILIVDELDSSIHFRLTRAIVAMFNNELNTNAQLIFTVHDINLMDCKKMFRKEQLWFVHKDENGVYLYSLADFTAKEGVRDTTDIIEKYRKGMLGALPEPELINSLLELNSK